MTDNQKHSLANTALIGIIVLMVIGACMIMSKKGPMLESEADAGINAYGEVRDGGMDGGFH